MQKKHENFSQIQLKLSTNFQGVTRVTKANSDESWNPNFVFGHLLTCRYGMGMGDSDWLMVWVWVIVIGLCRVQ